MDSMAISARETVEVIGAVDHPVVNILCDQANLMVSQTDSYEEALPLQQPYIRHVHVNDHVNGRRLAAVLGGQGIVPWPKIVPLLVRSGYREFLTLEYEMRWFPTGIPSPEVVVVEGASTSAGCWPT